MKKLLLSTAALAVLAIAAPAYAEEGGVELELGGYFKGYLGYSGQNNVDDIDTSTLELDEGADTRGFDWLQDSEIHFGGETTLDNGLNVGAHFEMTADRSEGDIQESYIYFSGDWGRFNLGAEDGAAFLLQVAAPSGDENYDGIRQYINPFNYSAAVIGDDLSDAILDNTSLDYAQSPTGYAEKITYLTPQLSGFQLGLSYAPDVSAEFDPTGTDATNLGGFRTDNVVGQYGSAYEGALRYEGQFQEVGIIAGGGYTFVDLEDDDVGGLLDDRNVWNLGLNFKYAAFSLGGVYRDDDRGVEDNGDSNTWVIGADYTTGPFKFGLSYFDNSADLSSTDEVDTNRYTGGVVYQYGPGMTFRGSVSYVEHDMPEGYGDDVDGMVVLLGTQVNF